MKWDSEKSVTLTKICIMLFTAAYVAVLCACSFIVEEFVDFSCIARPEDALNFMVTIYICAIPIGVVLWKLYGLVAEIGQEVIFTEENIKRLRVISWMCFAVAMICLASTVYYIFYIVIAACSAFMGLLIRVIKNVFVRALQIKEENDYTI